MISENKITEVESIIGVKFLNKKFLSQALVHKSFSNDNSSNNEEIGNLFTFWKWHKSIRFNRILKFIK